MLRVTWNFSRRTLSRCRHICDQWARCYINNVKAAWLTADVTFGLEATQNTIYITEIAFQRAQQKLRLKDIIAQIEDRLTPDIIA